MKTAIFIARAGYITLAENKYWMENINE